MRAEVASSPRMPWCPWPLLYLTGAKRGTGSLKASQLGVFLALLAPGTCHRMVPQGRRWEESGMEVAVRDNPTLTFHMLAPLPSFPRLSQRNVLLGPS